MASPTGCSNTHNDRFGLECDAVAVAERDCTVHHTHLRALVARYERLVTFLSTMLDPRILPRAKYWPFEFKLHVRQRGHRLNALEMK